MLCFIADPFIGFGTEDSGSESQHYLCDFIELHPSLVCLFPVITKHLIGQFMKKRCLKHGAHFLHLVSAFLLVCGIVESPHGETEKACFYNNTPPSLAQESTSQSREQSSSVSVNPQPFLLVPLLDTSQVN